MASPSCAWVMASAGRTMVGLPRSVNAPAATITGKGTAYWLPSMDAWDPGNQRGKLDA